MMKILSIFGTRPEAIKMAPLVHKLAESPHIQSQVCVTGQHREMLDQMLSVFNITPAENLYSPWPEEANRKLIVSQVLMM